MSALAVVGGFAEAAVLVIIARIGFALSSHSADVTVNAGPLPSFTISVPALLAIAGALVVVRVAMQLAQVRIATAAAVGAYTRTRKSLMHSYIDSSWSLQSAQREGRLQELVTIYANTSSNAVSSISSGIIAVFSLAAFLVSALIVNVVASVVIAVSALVIALLLRPLRAAVRRRSARSADAHLAFATGVTEFTSTLQEVRIFGVGAEVRRRLDALTDREAALAARTWILSSSIPALYQGTTLLIIVGALAAGYATGFSRLASLGAVVLIMLRSLSYGQSIQGSLQSLNENAPYLESLLEEEGRYREAAMKHGGQSVASVHSIEFAHVWFEYEPGVPVLRDLSFEVRPGEIIGIVGPSGSGKSTLVQLLLRLREPTTGVVLADGRDVRELSLDEWYSHISFVPQDAHLFSGTIAENIRFFREPVDDAAVERAAKLAHLHDDIVAWPLGYQTLVGERGGQLSGGQRQRLCIARALVEEPDVIVLDEPTSALDVRSEALMRETMTQLAPSKTVFVIAHRMSTLSMCDRIMVVLGGVLEGFDEPARLEATNPFYREALKLSGIG